MRRPAFGIIATIAVSLFCASPVSAACRLGVELVATGLNRPVGTAYPPGGSQRLFIIEQHTGRIKILDLKSSTLLTEPFLDIDGLATGNEQGLLGLVFHPNYAENGLFFVNLTISGGDTQIRRYRVSADDPTRADPGSMAVVLSYDQPFGNHNGGWLAFGPDGYLYIGTGDGGGSFDPGNRGQNLGTLLGKLLRIDVDGTDGSTGLYGIPADNPFVGVPGARPEIWAYGLRNPWRCSFDRATGDLYIADVGQREIEEVSFQPAGSPGGENYGWRVMEGRRCNDNAQTGGNPPCNDPSLVEPIHQYSHAVGFSITGGYVYRGQAISGLAGTYFFADYVEGRIWSFRFDGQVITEFAERTDELEPPEREIGISLISSFGEDADGELYILDMGDGEVFKLVQAEPPIEGDLNGDCQVDFADLNILAGNWMAGKETTQPSQPPGR
jgi:glucose/arabinose dehydrogenase